MASLVGLQTVAVSLNVTRASVANEPAGSFAFGADTGKFGQLGFGYEFAVIGVQTP